MRGIIESLLVLGLVLRWVNCKIIEAPKIAVIGGGIGGATVAHYLNELFSGNLSIDLFEAEIIGGRLATIQIDGNEYEAGGSVIHERNLLMKRFLTLLGKEQRPSCGAQNFGIWNKDEFVFEESSYQLVTFAKLIFRYGAQPFSLHRYVGSVLDDFDRIYELHDNGVAFTNVTSLLSAMNVEFPKLLKISIKDHLAELGYSSRIIDELVETTLVGNYGQDTQVQSFVGLVSVAGAGAELWSVKGGNKNIPKLLIDRNDRVNGVNSIVERIVHLSNTSNKPQYELHYTDKESSESLKGIYDMVILATPLTEDQKMPIKFEGFPHTTRFEFPGTYQSTFVTFVRGDLNLKYFNLEDPIDVILSCSPEKTIISAIGRLVSTEGNCSRVWKIFTRKGLDQKTIDEMFTKVEDIRRVVWKAYPNYSSSEEPRLDFKLHDFLYHVNAIEWAASAMEMSAIGGRNVAILAYNEYQRNRDKSSLEWYSGDESKTIKQSAHQTPKNLRSTDL